MFSASEVYILADLDMIFCYVEMTRDLLKSRPSKSAGGTSSFYTTLTRGFHPVSSGIKCEQIVLSNDYSVYINICPNQVRQYLCYFQESFCFSIEKLIPNDIKDFRHYY